MAQTNPFDQFDQDPLDPTQEARTRQAENQADASELDAELAAARIQAQRAAAAASGASAANSAANAARTNVETERLQNRLTDAQKAVDAEFATLYAEMQIGGGLADRRKQLDQLRDALVQLESSDTISGPVIGRMAEFVQQAVNPDAINVREQVEEVVQRNLRIILGAQFTEKEGERLISRAFNPRLEEGTNADRLIALIDQIETSFDNTERAMRYYEEKGTVAGWTPEWRPDGAAEPTPPADPAAIDPNESALNQLRTDGGRGPERQAADFDATEESLSAPPAMVREHDRLVTRLASENGGRIPPDAYAAARAQLDEKYGRGSDMESNRAWATGVNEYLDAGGKTIPTGISDLPRTMSMVDTLRNKAIANPLGAAVGGFANAGGFGIPSALLPEQAAAISDAYPLETIGGEIGGAITGTSMLGGLARNTVGRAAPRFLGGGTGSQVARNIATDATYAGAYGGFQGQDPLTSAALGAAGSYGGQKLGQGLGAAIGGIQRSQPVQNLLDRGVRLSVGRQLGPTASRAEDLLQSVPVVGGRVRDRMQESFADFNQAAFKEAATPISGFQPNAIGREGLEQLDDAVGQAYSDALGGRSFAVDPTFSDDLTSAAVARAQLPDDVAARLDKLVDNHISPIEQTGQITGETYQRARRGLGKARNNAGVIAGEFDQPYRETVTGVLDAFDNQLGRAGGDDVIEGLAAANQANRNYRIVENASLDRAKVGTQTGEVNTFTPAQLLQASRASERKFPGDTSLRMLAEDGQAVLPPTIPNSGTADRAMAATALGGIGLGGLGLGESYYREGDLTGTASLAGIAGALALLGTRRGQQAMQTAAFERPTIMQMVGQGVRRRSGMFGSGAVPIVVQN